MIRNLLFAIIILLGGVLFFTKDLQLSESRVASAIGRVGETKGLVLGKSQEQESFTNLASKTALQGPLHIVTGIESEVDLQFGEAFKVLEKSSVRLSKQANRFFVEVIRGSVQRTKPEPHVEFQVEGQSKKGLNISAPQNQTMVALQVKENQAIAGAIATPTSPDFQNLITSTMNLHQRFLEKCFIKLYEKQKGSIAAGVVNTRFQINKKGHVASVQIIASDFQDQDFKSCVQEVISRVQFKGYREEPRTVDFPIQIQLPQ